MPSRKRWGFLLAAAAGLAHAAGGEVPSDALGTDRDGAPVTVGAERGKVVVISFWASWCPYCLKELPILEGIQRTAGAANVKVIAVNAHESPALYRKLVDRFRTLEITFTHDRDGSLERAYGVKGLPHMVIVGRDGRVAYQHVGYGEKMLDTIVDELNGLLAEPAAAAAAPGA